MLLETKATIDPAARRALFAACDELIATLEILAQRGRAIRKADGGTSLEGETLIDPGADCEGGSNQAGGADD